MQHYLGRIIKINTATKAKMIPILRHVLRAGGAPRVAERTRKIAANRAKKAEMWTEFTLSTPLHVICARAALSPAVTALLLGASPAAEIPVRELQITLCQAA